MGNAAMTVDAIYRTPESAAALRRHYQGLLAGWPVPHTEDWVSTHLGDTFVVASGHPDAPPAILLHGSGAIRLRTERVPIFTDVELTRIAAPTLVVVGQKDALLNSVETKQRLEQHAPRVTVILIPDARHILPTQTDRVHAFLTDTTR
jgi:pimeloyl-ACP methyl ester carboxylesterase